MDDGAGFLLAGAYAIGCTLGAIFAGAQGAFVVGLVITGLIFLATRTKPKETKPSSPSGDSGPGRP